jgi:hypothetical protein
MSEGRARFKGKQMLYAASHGVPHRAQPGTLEGAKNGPKLPPQSRAQGRPMAMAGRLLSLQGLRLSAESLRIEPYRSRRLFAGLRSRIAGRQVQSSAR